MVLVDYIRYYAVTKDCTYPEDVKDDKMIIIICYDILVRVRNRIKANNFYISHILIHSCCIYTTTNMFLPKDHYFYF